MPQIIPQGATYRPTPFEQKFERWLESRGYEVRRVVFVPAHLLDVVQRLIDADEASAPIGQAVDELPASAPNIRATGTHIRIRIERVKGGR
jgi:hypothetical protein